MYLGGCLSRGDIEKGNSLVASQSVAEKVAVEKTVCSQAPTKQFDEEKYELPKL
jgi:hypothetical protein